MRRLARALAVGAGLCLLAVMPSAAAQTDGDFLVASPDLHALPTVSVVVSAPVDVTPQIASGVTVTEAGRLRDVRVEPVPVDDLQVVLAIDTSGSMAGTPIDAAKAAAVQFLDQVPARTPIAVVGFGDKVTVHSAFTADKTIARDAIGALQARGETTLNDAVVNSTQLFPTDSPARRVIVLLTDGRDTRSANDLAAAIDRATKAKVEIFGVALRTPETDYPSLQSLSTATGGLIASADDAPSLGRTFDQITAAVVNRYRLTWESDANGSTDTVIRFATPDGSSLSRTLTIVYPERPVVLADSGPASTAAVTTLPAPSPNVFVIEQGGLASSTKLLVIGALAIFAALVVVSRAVLLPRLEVRRLGRELGVQSRGQISELQKRAVGAIDRVIANSSRHTAFETMLERAGISLGPAEAALAVLGAVLIGFFLALLFFGVLWAGLSVPAIIGLAFVALRLRVDQRSRRFANQLDSTLQLMVSTLRSGYGVAQAVDAVAREAAAPTGEEFRRAAREARIGRELTAALRGVAERTDCEDFTWVVDAIEINREVGGSLAEVLENASITLRDRSRLRRQVRALSAEGRLSGVVLMALPIMLFFYIQASNPDYIDPLVHSGLGQVLLGIGLGLMAAGGAWLRRIVNIKY